MHVRCPYCHELIPQASYAAHEQQHARRKSDGQHTDHVTKAPDQRYKGSLQGVPKVYRHDRCGRKTGMPEEIIRSYLADPLLYNDRTFCTGCGDYFSGDEMTWVETGENMMDYNGRLRAEYLERVYGIPRDEQRRQVVVVTPPAAEAVRRFGDERGLSAPYSLALMLDPAKGKPGYVCGARPMWRDGEATVLLSEGVQVVVPTAQVEQLRGTIAHFSPPPRASFLFLRLYAPKKRA